jgi:hypothetical protein
VNSNDDAPAATLRCPAPLRSSRHFHVPAFVARDSPCLAAALPDPPRFAILFRLRTCHYFPVVALATVLLAHSPAFGRSDEILYLVEKASRNAPPSLVSLRPADPSVGQRSAGSTRHLVASKSLPSSPSPSRIPSVVTSL